MPFWNDFVDGVKDVGTSATRIVTDTAIDIGDVATGFQFSDDMARAKKKMTDAGVLSAADAIEKNHYPFLKTMAKEAERNVVQIQTLFAKGQAEERRRAELIGILGELCADVVNLSALSLEAEDLLTEARKIKHWETWADAIDLTKTDLKQVSATGKSVEKWEKIGTALTTSNLVVNSASSFSALVAMGAMSRGRKLTKLAKGGKLAARAGLSAGTKGSKVALKAAKFLKVGKIAGRASGVLAVVTVGIDIGLSVLEMEQRKSQLEDQQKQLRGELATAQRDLAVVVAENGQIQKRIDDVLRSVKPRQTLGSWPAWFDDTKRDLEQTIRKLVSVSGIAQMAREKAVQTRGQPLRDRIRYVVAVDPEISPEEAEDIIRAIDTEDGIASSDFADLGGVSEISALTWTAKGPETCTVETVPGLDGLKLQYAFIDQPGTSAWTYYATAPWGRAVTIKWRYGAAHTPASLAAKVTAFVDTAGAGRSYHTLYAGAPQTVADPATGEITLLVEAGQVFGITISPVTESDRPGRQYCGSYTCHPVENDWHMGTIDFKDDDSNVLQWTNRAGARWDLLAHAGSDQLLKLPGSPYQDQYPGGNSFEIQRKGGKITGFDFLRALYSLDPGSGKAPKKAGGAGLNLGLVWLEFTNN